MTPQPTPTPGPTPDELAQAQAGAQDVAQAASDALERGGGPSEVHAAVSDAFDAKLKELNLPISDEQRAAERDRQADVVIEKLRVAGAFDQSTPAEATPTPAEATPEQAAAQEADAAATQPTPQKKSFAERFAGI